VRAKIRWVVLLGLVACSSRPVEPSDANVHHARADQAFQTFLLDYWNGYYLTSSVPLSLRLPGYWIFAQAFDLVLDNVERTGGYRGWIQTFYDAADAHGWSRDLFDDENWMVLALLRAYDATADQKYLTRAVDIFQDIRTQAPDTTCCGAMPGGLWWDRAHTSKATAINGGAVISAVRLSERTGDPSYFELAKSTYAFWTARMRNPDTHQIGDHFMTNGNIVWWAFTYNEGLMIGGALELYRVTQDTSYLDDAHRYAGFMLAHETTSTDGGPVLHDGVNSCDGDCPMFKGIGYRYLLRLQQVSPRPEYAQALKASADAAWTVAKSPARPHFGTDWAAPPPTDFVIEADASAGMALSGYAASLGAYPSTSDAGVYEAEEGALHQLKVAAARGGGQSGWGYVTGWSAEGQTVSLDVEVPEAGPYELSFRYSTLDVDASRRVSVAGQTAAADFRFPGSSSWGEVPLDVTLTKGTSTIELAFVAAAGSHGTIDLDRVSLRAAR
jgi:predicted alpha-1,6-mannanase (GH76 family)